jgi:hypothetical protein
VQQFAAHEQRRKRLERRAMRRSVPVDRLHQTDCADLLEVGPLETVPPKALRSAAAEIPIFRNETLARN